NSAFSNPPFVALGLILGNTQSNQGSSDATDSATHANTSQGGHNRTSSDERAYAGNRQRTNSGQPSQSSADHSPCACACGGTFGRFGAFLGGKIFRTFVLREQD